MLEKNNLTKKIIIAIILALIFSSMLIMLKDTYPSFFSSSIAIADIIGTIFLRLLKFVIVPIVIFSLINGIVNLDSMGSLVSLGTKTIVLFFSTTAIALVLAISVSYFLNAGESFSSDSYINEAAKLVTDETPPSLSDNIVNLFPSNIISPMLETNMIQIVFMSILFGIAILGIKSNERKKLSNALNHLEQVVVGVINMIMKLTPYGIFCLLTQSMATQGLIVLGAMLEYALIMVLIIFLQFSLVYIPLIKVLKLNILTFLKKCFSFMTIAFATASSSATLPVSIKVATQSFKVPKTFSSFILPLGSTIHMNGTVIMQGLAVVFLSNLYGVEMSIYDYLGASFLAMVATIGAAGIPGSGLITLTIILVQYNIPLEGIGIIIGIDRLLEMIRTLMNVTGDMIVTLLVTKSEGHLDAEYINNSK